MPQENECRENWSLACHKLCHVCWKVWKVRVKLKFIVQRHCGLNKTKPLGRLKWPYIITRLTLYVCPVVWSGDLQVYKNMVLHDTRCPYWDQVSLNNINPPTFVSWWHHWWRYMHIVITLIHHIMMSLMTSDTSLMKSRRSHFTSRKVPSLVSRNITWCHFWHFTAMPGHPASLFLRFDFFFGFPELCDGCTKMAVPYSILAPCPHLSVQRRNCVIKAAGIGLDSERIQADIG